MPASSVDVLQGTLDVLVLKALSWGPRHGHGVARVIRDSTSGTLDVTDGSLYVALHRLEERGLVESEWGLSEANRRAKYYRLTAAGRAQRRAEGARLVQYANAILRVFDATSWEAAQ
jgi:PadR family transcriptional regulator, regulatory protein PadR